MFVIELFRIKFSKHWNARFPPDLEAKYVTAPPSFFRLSAVSWAFIDQIGNFPNATLVRRLIFPKNATFLVTLLFKKWIEMYVNGGFSVRATTLLTAEDIWF